MRDLDRIKEKVVIRLDNRQVAMAIVGFIIVSTATFAGGVVVGKQMGDALPGSLDELAGIEAALGEPGEHRGRELLLARISPGTQGINAELMRGSEEIAVDDPAQAARIEAHKQIAAARAQGSAGVARSLGPVPVKPAGEAPKPIEPLNLIERDPKKEKAAMGAGVPVRGAFAMQVSVFSSEGPAQVVAEQLLGSGHKAGVRRVQAQSGKTVWRVEVGRFEDVKKAEKVQKEFERASGYSTVLVPVP